MKPLEFYEQLGGQSAAAAALLFNPYYRPMSGLRHGRPELAGQACFDLASNDYLGLASDPRLQHAMAAALAEYGASMCGTPIATGYARVLAELEQELSRFVGLEAAVVFPSCYQANAALFPAIATPQDVILVDHYAHASLAQGIKAVGCRIRPFLHNNLAHLERQLAASRTCRQIFVVTESVFSTEGSVAPLDGIVALCRRYEAIPVVDDSHGLGVLGQTGRGILEAQNLADYEGIYTASLGKALANLGGVVAGKRSFIAALRYSCPGLIYSTALSPVCVAGLLKAIEILRSDFGLLGPCLWQSHRYLVAQLRQAGFSVASGGAPIAAVHGGAAEQTIGLAEAFARHGILATPFVPPSVPPGQGILRLIVGAKLDADGLAQVGQAIEQTGQELQRKALLHSVAHSGCPKLVGAEPAALLPLSAQLIGTA